MAPRRGWEPRPSVCLPLIAVLVAGAPSSRATQQEPAPASVLAVSSDPAGATVYVDGDYRGRTPLDVNDLTSGDHRVTIALRGYLENSRRVNLAGGRARGLHVTLTSAPEVNRQVEEGPPRAAAPPPEEKGGGGKKVLLIGAGVAALGAGVYLALPKNDPPTAGTVVASPAIALMAVTSVTFSAQGASDPDGDALTYAWDFGDGTSGSGPTIAHVFQTAGSFRVTVTVSDGTESTSATGSVTVRSLSGTWAGDTSRSSGNFLNFTISQSGANLTGTYTDRINGSGTITGRVTPSRAITIQTNIPGFSIGSWEGTVDESLDRITGTVDWFREGIATFALNRR